MLIGLAAGLAAAGNHAQALGVYRTPLASIPPTRSPWSTSGWASRPWVATPKPRPPTIGPQRQDRARPWRTSTWANARFRRGDLLGAGVAYRAAVESDPGLARAHFYLAVVLVNGGGDLEEALSALYSAAEFAPDDEEVRRVLQQVEAAVNRPGG